MVSNLFKRILRKLYRLLPISLDVKIKFKQFLFTYAGFCFKSFSSYQLWLAYNQKKAIKSAESVRYPILAKQLLDLDIKVGVHVHLFYTDLLNDILRYLNNMPVQYDLFVSVTNHSAQAAVERACIKLSKLRALSVKIVPNRGRDVAPMIVEFASDLLKYDYICHIHTKKSLHSGTEQTIWREHLFENLLGSPDKIKQIFGIFQANSKLGLIYPETVMAFPYWGHTWLSNYGISQKFLLRLNILIAANRYIDYPVGTMFWAKADALAKLFLLGLKYSDFQDEQQQLDGTLAHVIERSIVPIVQNNGYDFAVIDFIDGWYSLNSGSKNLWQYWGKTKEQLLKTIHNYDIISFDIFDTLLTRVVFEPNAVFLIMQQYVLSKYLLTDFMLKRHEAEQNCRAKLKEATDCKIDDIYQALTKFGGFTTAICDELKNLELNLELALSIPRQIVVEIFNYVKQLGKPIILVSDMYLPKEFIVQLLDKHSIYGYVEIYMSCETGLRKDTGSIWEFLYHKNAKNKILHIGDNETSDIKLALDYKVDAYHIMSGNILFELSSFNSLQFKSNYTLADNILLGLISAKLFNDPFSLHKTKGRVCITDLTTFGYVFIGPLILAFMSWLAKQLRRQQIKNVLFLAREGYLLEQVYRIINQSSLQNQSYGVYFLTSRRAASIAAIAGIKDIQNIIKRPYEGELGGLMKNRFGVEASASLAKQYVEMPRDFNKFEAKLALYYPQILAQAKIEKDAYMAYIARIKDLDLEQRTAVVDLGYSGSIQYYLANLLNVPLHGYYFVLNDEFLGLQYSGNQMLHCFSSATPYLEATNAVFKYHLLLEAIFTADTGQLVNFKLHKDSIVPNFKGTVNSEFNDIKMVHNGVLEFIRTAMAKFGPDVFNYAYDLDQVSKIFALCVEDKDILDNRIKQVFKVEDGYNANNNLSIFDLYRQVGII